LFSGAGEFHGIALLDILKEGGGDRHDRVKRGVIRAVLLVIPGHKVVCQAVITLFRQGVVEGDNLLKRNIDRAGVKQVFEHLVGNHAAGKTEGDPLSVIAQHGEQFTLFHAACIGGCQGEAAGFVAVGIPGLIVDFNVKLRRVTRILHGICKGVRQLAQLKNLVALCTLLDGVDQLGGRVPGFFDKFTAYRVGLRLIVHGAGRLRPVDFGAARLGGRLCRICGGCCYQQRGKGEQR